MDGQPGFSVSRCFFFPPRRLPAFNASVPQSKACGTRSWDLCFASLSALLSCLSMRPEDCLSVISGFQSSGNFKCQGKKSSRQRVSVFLSPSILVCSWIVAAIKDADPAGWHAHSLHRHSWLLHHFVQRCLLDGSRGNPLLVRQRLQFPFFWGGQARLSVKC